MKLKLHHRIANRLGYDLRRHTSQMTLSSHLRFLLGLLDIGVVLDVGANMGQFGHQLRREVGFSGEIHSFEPVPASFHDLLETSAEDPAWHAHNTALSDRCMDVIMNVANNSVFSSLHVPNALGRSRFKGLHCYTEVPVRTQRLDEYAQAHLPAIAEKRGFLKIDTQGHDGAVFRGCGSLLEGIYGFQSELPVMGIYDGAADYVELLSEYRDAGFELTGVYPVNRHRTGHIVDMDCVFVRSDA